MKNLIAYSLYNNAPRYYVGAIKNAIIAQRIAPNFTLRFYVGESVPSWVVSTLWLMPNVEIIEMMGAEDARAMFWRFYALADLDYDYILIRDADARLNLRELAMHQEFIDSGQNFHIIKDHPTGHNYTISGGLFAAKKIMLHDIHKLVDAWGPKPIYGNDMEFLQKWIYPRVIGETLIHDEYFNTPNSIKCKIAKKSTLDMVGAALDENDRFIYDNDLKMSMRETGSEHCSYAFTSQDPQTVT